MAQAMYDRYRMTKSSRTKRAPSVDTHRNVLAETVGTFVLGDGEGFAA